MRLFLRETPESKVRPLAGPGDLAGRSGVVLVEGLADETAASRWAVSLGLFVGRGGEVRRLS